VIIKTADSVTRRSLRDQRSYLAMRKALGFIFRDDTGPANGVVAALATTVVVS